MNQQIFVYNYEEMFSKLELKPKIRGLGKPVFPLESVVYHCLYVLYFIFELEFYVVIHM